ncbi:uncharacterized protein ACLA_060410 [Aspergillus clavatus NRRL 1]|uniref:Uncharacterized protein n=1 Tax=Aspergillus clavatus (strain ATCC 1007 / CBS 513.65 / DSM 816 / NCTC 3887 / NRRL 1 / QM 1276 / 107) TaxID=344612 RepID=A1C4N3_ASPCL|nr:uncharacterized protein ACLA_060410 [Aspergillus clavatus NRRL 1]EAW15373.1 hypothetical protein ACLA_060410 [Aspergillus clavatus NRRL 1]
MLCGREKSVVVPGMFNTPCFYLGKSKGRLVGKRVNHVVASDPGGRQCSLSWLADSSWFSDAGIVDDL